MSAANAAAVSFAAIEAHIREIRRDLKSSTKELRQEMKSGIGGPRAEMKSDIGRLREEMNDLRADIKSMQRPMLYGFFTLGGLILAFAGVQIA